MPDLVLVATPGASDANTYCDRATAETIAAQVYPSPDAWADTSPDDQNRMLATVTRLIDALEVWMWGERASTTQALAYPRIGAPLASTYGTEDHLTLPDRVVRATARGAFALATLAKQDPTTNPLAPSQHAGLTSFAIGSEFSATLEAGAGAISTWDRLFADVVEGELGTLLRAKQRKALRG